jgi:hypothetical protein
VVWELSADVAVIISVINHTDGLISDAEIQDAIRGVNRQIHDDFAPYWGMDATLRLEGHAGRPSDSLAESGENLADMRGDALIYVWHPVDLRGALGYHARNFLGIPYGFVFPQVSQQLNEPWPVSLSHEALEMIADPEVNLLVMGPHPANPGGVVFYWYEMCDAVQAESYEVDGVPVSNFLLPLYFTSSDEAGSRNDFLNLAPRGRTLRSFGVNPGGYVGFYNPETRRHESFAAEGDRLAVRRMEIKGQLELTRRSQRYQHRTSAGISITSALRQYRGGA